MKALTSELPETMSDTVESNRIMPREFAALCTESVCVPVSVAPFTSVKAIAAPGFTMILPVPACAFVSASVIAPAKIFVPPE